MNSEEKKLTEYLHNIIEENISLRKQNDILWKQKLKYIDRIGKAIEYIKNKQVIDLDYLEKILKGDVDE